ncbi:glycosyltransferase [Mesorhizobium sp. L103C131B0]|uniref:glycosyltransferase family 8 protein n=1 Tax=Mesorhizobium sp. L103C131B0 TaxID=1287089 RepID=UPI0018C8FE0C|nr:glycosyltransferase [Mesorhizobium sp. L103C131B0]
MTDRDAGSEWCNMSQKSCFFFAADQKFFPFACLAARRVLDVSTPVDGFILHTGIIPSEDRDAGERLLGGKIGVIDVTEFMDATNYNRATHPSLAAYIRLFADRLPEFESYDRIVYSDADVLFNRSIADLCNTPLKAPLLAAHDEQTYFDAKFRKHLPVQPGAPKFNSGVLVFNMPLVRREGLLERTRELASEHVYGMDQGPLNVAFEGRWQTMHPFWNVMTNYTSQIPFSRCYARHFAWGKPWDRPPIGVEVEAMAIYRDLAKGTPWAGRFSSSWPVKRGILKNLGRKFDAISGILLNDEKRKRRARFDAEKVSAIFADHADKSMLAVQYPERVAGIAR